jgi:hypothetical protein
MDFGRASSPPPDQPLDIETLEPIEPPWQAIREWIPDDDADPSGDLFDQTPVRSTPVEIRRQDGSILALDSAQRGHPTVNRCPAKYFANRSPSVFSRLVFNCLNPLSAPLIPEKSPIRLGLPCAMQLFLLLSPPRPPLSSSPSPLSNRFPGPGRKSNFLQSITGSTS